MSDHLFIALQRAMAAQGAKPALILGEQGEIGFDALLERTARLCSALAEQGLGPGDRLLAQVDKSAANVALYLATLQRGAIYVPINTAYTLEEVGYFLGDAQPTLLVVDDVSRYHDLGLVHSEGMARLLALGRFEEEQDGTQADDSLVALAANLPGTSVTASKVGADVAAILYTSGTTGRSKGAMLTHHNLRSNAEALLDLWGWQDNDVLLHALPIFHVHGLFVALHCAFLGGSSTLFRAGFDALEVRSLLPSATVMMGVPTFYTRLLSLPPFGVDDCRTMRLFISGSAPLTEQTFAAFEARSGHRILERYGMSETLMNTSNPLTGERVPGTVGYPLPGIEARIVDGDGVVVSDGSVGVIEVRGENVFSGYWHMPEKTASEFREDGFFITGDLGTQAPDGRIAIVGREKDLVISGGYNIYPKELERLLDEMPEVSESAVIGVPHADFGEAVVAIVVPTEPGQAPEEAAVRDFLQDRIARYKQPKAVRSAANLPRNAMGKVQKNALRDAFQDLFA